MEVSPVEEICGHRSLDTIHSSLTNFGCHESHGNRYQETRNYTSSNRRRHGCRSSLTIHSYSCNHGGYFDGSESRLQETSHSSY